MPTLVQNKKAYHDYHVLEKLEAGMVLSGAEVKSVKNGQMNLKGSYVSFNRENEAWMIGCHIAPYKHATTIRAGSNPSRPRKLLLHKKEIIYLESKNREPGLTILPLSIYTKGNLIKAEIGVVRGKKKFDKREQIKKRDIEREIGRKMKR